MIKKLKVKKYLGSNKKVNEDREKRVSITKSLTTFQIYLKRRHKAEGTREDYNRDLLQFLSFLAEQLDVRVRYIDNITKANIREYEDYLLDRNLSGEYKVNTVKRKLKSLRAYYKFLNYTYGIPNLMAEENIIGQLKDDAKKIEDNYFTDDEIKKLFKYIDGLNNDKGYRDRAMLYFLYYTGCRRSEMLNIKWSDIDMIDKTVRIYRSKTHNWGRVNLHEKVIKEIVRYSDIYGYKSDYVFPKPSDMDSPFDGNTFYDRFRSLMKRSGITRTGLSPHSMRHTFVTKNKKAGTSDDTIIDYTGHAKVTGLKPYTHISREQKDMVFTALEIDHAA